MKAKINNKTYINFGDFTISSNLDSIASTFSLSAFFDINNIDHQKIFKPLSYNKIEVFDDEDKLLITGTILNHDFGVSAVTDLVQLSGYSLPGVLEDCNIPYSMYPLESLKMNLGEIARKVIKPFGLTLSIEPSVSKDVSLSYAKSVCEPEDSIKDYLSKLSAQRNIILSHNRQGYLVMFRPNVNLAVKKEYDEKNTTSLGLSVNGQNMHSSLTILRQPKMKKKKTESTVSIADHYDEEGNEIPEMTKTKKKRPKPQFFDTLHNSMVKAFRPSVKKMTEGEDVSTEPAVRNDMADELGNISFSIELDRWDDLNIGDMINLQSNRLFIKNKVKLIVSSISRSRTASEKKMSISAMLPEAFTGQEPKNIFL